VSGNERKLRNHKYDSILNHKYDRTTENKLKDVIVLKIRAPCSPAIYFHVASWGFNWWQSLIGSTCRNDIITPVPIAMYLISERIQYLTVDKGWKNFFGIKCLLYEICTKRCFCTLMKEFFFQSRRPACVISTLD